MDEIRHFGCDACPLQTFIQFVGQFKGGAIYAYEGVDTETLAEGLNYLVHGAWYWDTFNPDTVRSEALHTTELALLRQAFPKSF